MRAGTVPLGYQYRYIPRSDCFVPFCQDPIEKNAVCFHHRVVLPPEMMARFDDAWEGKSREDWFKLGIEIMDYFNRKEKRFVLAL